MVTQSPIHRGWDTQLHFGIAIQVISGILSGAMAAIYLTDASGTPLAYELNAEFMYLLGSGEDCDIRITDTEGVAEQHCELLWNAELNMYMLQACSPELMITANGESHNCVALVAGVPYGIGSAQLTYAEELSAAEETPAEEEEAGVTKVARAEVVQVQLKRKPVGRTRSLRSSTAHVPEIEITRENPIVTLIKPIYVIAVLAAAFLAGLTLHHLLTTGEFFPATML